MSEAIETATTRDERPLFDSAFLRMTTERLDHLDDISCALWQAVEAASEILAHDDCDKSGALRAGARAVSEWIVTMYAECREVRRMPSMMQPRPVIAPDAARLG